MTDDADWVLLVECYSVAELHMLRATLEVHGVPFRVQGEHTHGVLGPIQGAMVRSRMLVPRRALPVARSLAEDIVGPFDERPELGDEDESASPFRTSAEQAPAEDTADADDDDAAAPDEPDALDERRRPPSLRPRSYAVLLLIAFMGGSLFGLAHLYVRRNVPAGILAMISIVSLAALTRGAEWPLLVLAVVWVLDLVGGVNGVYEDARRIAAPAPAPSNERPVA